MATCSMRRRMATAPDDNRRESSGNRQSIDEGNSMGRKATAPDDNRRESSGTRQSIVDEGISIHDEALYKANHDAMPIHVDCSTGSSCSKGLIQHYEEKGYVTITGILSDVDVTTAQISLTDLCEGKNEKFNSAVKKSYDAAAVDNLDFKDGDHHAFVQYERGTEVEVDSTALTSAAEGEVRKLMGFCAYEQILADIAGHPTLISLLKTLMRIPESAELEVFQDMALLKGIGGREKPYHQDHAYFNIPLNAKVVGVWIALDEATKDNGCMRCLPSLHRRSTAERIISPLPDTDESAYEGTSANKSTPEYAYTDINDEFPLWHYMRRDFQICDDMIYRLSDHITSCPLPKGGMMIFDSKLPHGTPTNNSNLRRRALQFHYVVKGVPRVEESVRLKFFGGEGSGVEC